MKINQQKTVQVDVRTMEIHCKVSDSFSYQLKDEEGKLVFNQDDGYVPSFMPGQHYGDYIILTIDLDSGHVVNWTAPSAADLEAVIKPESDD